MTEEHKRKISEANKKTYKKGRIPIRYWKGKKRSPKVVKQMSVFRKGKHFSSKTEFKKG